MAKCRAYVAITTGTRFVAGATEIGFSDGSKPDQQLGEKLSVPVYVAKTTGTRLGIRPFSNASVISNSTALRPRSP